MRRPEAEVGELWAAGTPILYVVPDSRDIERVTYSSLFNDPTVTRRRTAP
jgi:hypothetical protein